MPMRSRKWMWVTLLLTLVLGMSLGVILDELVLERGGSDRGGSGDSGNRNRRFMAVLDKELDLSPEQEKELERVLAANDDKARAFWTETRSAYAKLRKEFRQEIRTLLTPEQQKRFDEMMARHGRRHHRSKERR